MSKNSETGYTARHLLNWLDSKGIDHDGLYQTKGVLTKRHPLTNYYIAVYNVENTKSFKQKTFEGSDLQEIRNEIREYISTFRVSRVKK